MSLPQVKWHKKNTGKVNGSAVNHIRKRMCKELKTGVRCDEAGNPIVDKNGCVDPLTKRQKAFRAGVTTGIDLSTAAMRTNAGVDTRTTYRGLSYETTAIADAFAIPGKGGAKAHVKK